MAIVKPEQAAYFLEHGELDLRIMLNLLRGIILSVLGLPLALILQRMKIASSRERGASSRDS